MSSNQRYPYLPGSWLIAIPMLVCVPGMHATPSALDQYLPVMRSPIAQTSAAVTAFVDVAVVPMDRERILTHQTVLVEGGKITALGPATKVSIPTGAVRIDGRGKFLLPGLTDMHVHVTMSTANSVESEHRLLGWLTDGVTTVRNMDYGNDNDGQAALRLREQAISGALLSPRIYTAGRWAPIQYKAGRGRWKGPEPRLDSVAAYVEAYKAAGYDFIKIRDEARPEVLDSLFAAARRVGIPVAGHVPPGASLEQALAGGMRSIEHLTGYMKSNGLVHSPSVYDVPRVVASARAGIWNCPTLRLYETTSSNQVIKSRRDFIKMLQDSGAGLLLGSDAPGWNVVNSPVVMRTVTVHSELQALVRAGLSPYRALLTGTQNPATYFNTLDSTGTVAIGKRADLMLLAENPLLDIRHSRLLAGVMLSGRWLPRAVLEARRAGTETATQRTYYRDLAEDAYYAEVLLPLYQRITEDTSRQLTRDSAQHVLLRALTKSHEAERAALLDSLTSTSSVTSARSRARMPRADNPVFALGQGRVLWQAARQLGEYRVKLRPPQQAVFDSLAGVWLQLYTGLGYRLTIPGVRGGRP